MLFWPFPRNTCHLNRGWYRIRQEIPIFHKPAAPSFRCHYVSTVIRILLVKAFLRIHILSNGFYLQMLQLICVDTCRPFFWLFLGLRCASCLLPRHNLMILCMYLEHTSVTVGFLRGNRLPESFTFSRSQPVPRSANGPPCLALNSVWQSQEWKQCFQTRLSRPGHALSFSGS